MPIHTFKFARPAGLQQPLQQFIHCYIISIFTKQFPVRAFPLLAMLLIGFANSMLSTQAYLLQDMLLVIGDSFAQRLTSKLTTSDNVTAKGRPGATLASDSFRRWAIACAYEAQPEAVMLIIGGNDVASRDFQFRTFLSLIEELIAGIAAAGVPRIIIMPIPPRTSSRPQDVAVRQHHLRRKRLNLTLRGRFRSNAVRCPTTKYPASFVGTDGLHPSATGWRWLLSVVRAYT